MQMIPKSGIYNIKIQINKINNNAYANIVGITSQKYNNNDKKIHNKNQNYKVSLYAYA